MFSVAILAQAILAQGHLACAGGPVCLKFGVRHVGSSVPSTRRSKSICTLTQESGSTVARHRCGTEVGPSLAKCGKKHFGKSFENMLKMEGKNMKNKLEHNQPNMKMEERGKISLPKRKKDKNAK